MQSILEEFACGNITPGTQYFNQNSEYGKAIRAVADHEEQLLGKLNGEEKELFEKYNDAQSALN